MPEIEMAKAYDFKSTERRLYDWWEKSGYFKPSNDPRKPGFDPSKKPFVIAIPPANVTGELHLGHAMFVSMEDLMIRYHRMKGEPSLWIPGSDHAGIATQLQVEKMLVKEGTSREQIGREEFERRTWEWKEKYGEIIFNQIRRLGASCDWDRARFTLDEGLSVAVREAFVRLYEKGLIYRGPRMINWSPGLKTAVSDLEVEYSQEPGVLYYFKYQLADNPNEYIPVATTRPETILADTAVAVHPQDPRYVHFVGRKVLVPMLNREIPVIADTYVDREFGTGALKITPGHDPNDYAIGQRHKLPMLSMFDATAHVNEIGGPYAGLDRFACRKKIWKDMFAAGLVLKEQPYTMNVPRSQRGGEIIEPMISTQWFVKIQTLADAGLSAVKDGQIKIIPDRFTKVYYNWLENIQDWCISRQLWWGHRIPVWYCQDCGEMTVSRTDPTECSKCHSQKLVQDPDVLDTWFSSGLWPFSTLGWPEETPDFKYFYPTSILETGYDILFFWVARMIMDGMEFTGKPPYHTVYLHGLIRDEHGAKMSKTKGNVIDPLTVMDEMGTDALRFTLLVGSTPGNDMNLSTKKVEANRNFINKIWNATRLVLNTLQNAPEKGKRKPEWTLADRWIQTRLNQVIRNVDRLFTAHQYGEAGRQIYDFFWSEFADWYLEISKMQMTEGGDRAYYTAKVLMQVLDSSLRLLHPFIPFVTEELWGYLKKACESSPALFIPEKGWKESLMLADWPDTPPVGSDEEKVIDQFSLVMDLVRAIRNYRTEKNVTPGKKLEAEFYCGEKIGIIQEQLGSICFLSHLDRTMVTLRERRPMDMDSSGGLVVSGIEIFLKLEEVIDIEAERNRLESEIREILTQIDRLQNLLHSPFAEKAPVAVVEKEKQRLINFHQTLTKLKDQFDKLG